MNDKSTEQLIGRILEAYGFEFRAIAAAQKGYRNSSYGVTLKNGTKANVIVYKNEPNIDRRIRRTNDVGLYLFNHGMPVRSPLSKKVITLRSSTQTRYAALYNYLPGETIPWEAYTKKHIKLVGKAMGIMHYELRDYSEDLPLVVDEYVEITSRMKRYFDDESVAGAMRQKLMVSISKCLFDEAAELLRRCKTLPHQQALHMDFVRGNILFRAAQSEDTLTYEDLAVSGILDFEKAAYGSPIFDVARTLSFLLIDCKYKSPEKVTKYFLRSGYNKRGRAAKIGPDSPLLWRLVTLFLVYDFYKFLRHNPYESLAENEHFQRTKDILLERGVIRYSKQE